jgi:hypothetical protein
MIILIFVFFIATAVVRGDYFSDFESELVRTKTAITGDDFTYAKDKRKEIEIICPGTESPLVTIRDLIGDSLDGLSDETDGECMVLKLSGANFSLRLSINCDSKVEIES